MENVLLLNLNLKSIESHLPVDVRERHLSSLVMRICFTFIFPEVCFFCEGFARTAAHGRYFALQMTLMRLGTNLVQDFVGTH